MKFLRRLAIRRRLMRARRAFRSNYIEWKKTGSAAAKLNVNILAARLRELEGTPA
jgi:hypothetical protein